MSVKQNTLKGEFSLKGKGLHTGKEVCATFKPAAENTGYKIVRVDLEEKTEIPALAKYIELVDRASCLQKDGARSSTDIPEKPTTLTVLSLKKSKQPKPPSAIP